MTLADGSFEIHPRIRVVYGRAAITRVGEIVNRLPARRVLLVADPGLVAAGLVTRATDLLHRSGLDVVGFHDLAEDPTTTMVAAGRDVARDARVEAIVALGGGSSMDCAKAINMVLTNGGVVADYWRRGAPGPPLRPLLPSVGIPTTAGTGSEAQQYALISDAQTHAKMACGTPETTFHTVILDPELTLSQPAEVTAASGYDALSHAVETYVTRARTPISDLYAREAWRLLDPAYERVLRSPSDIDARAAMQLGAHFAGVAIEQSMLGATHACANPLTAHYGVTHGVAIALLLPHVVRWNADRVGDRYDELQAVGTGGGRDATLADRLERLARAAGFARTLTGVGGRADDIPALSAEAADQWTGRFNPRPFDASSAAALYQRAVTG